MTRAPSDQKSRPRVSAGNPSGNSPEVAHGNLRAGSLEGLIPGLVHGFSASLPFAGLPAFGEALGGLLAEAFSDAALPGSGENGRRGNDRTKIDAAKNNRVKNGAAPVMLEQPHGAKILLADSAGEKIGGAGPKRDFVKGYDGVVGDRSHPRILSVRAADCVPVLAADPELGAYAALHAGWRGVAAGILPNLLEGWRRAGSSLKSLRLAYGPSIRACCFEVREDCTSSFQAEHLAHAVHAVGGATHLDLIAVLQNQARTFGVAEGQAEVLPYCTTCYKERGGGYIFASYRRSRRLGLATEGRNASFISVAAARP